MIVNTKTTDKLHTIISNFFNTPLNKLSITTDLIMDLNADSLDREELFIELEEIYDIYISEK